MMTARYTRLLTRTAEAIALASLITLATATIAAGQRSGGTIRGTVTNADTHDPIKGARVSILNPERVAISDERGAFTLRDVPSGTYSVFTTAVARKPDSSSVTVSSGIDATLNVNLKEGSLLLSS